jgi:Xaa-Pro aminopeptidase
VSWTLDDGLAEISCRALLVVADSGRDPDLASFVGDAHLGECFLIRRIADREESSVVSDVTDRSSGRSWLCYLTAMERDEAASAGHELLDPAALGVDSARRRYGASPRFWKEILGRGLELAGISPTTLAIGGRLALGAGHLALSSLAEEGWRFEDGGPLILRHRKRKSVQQVDEVRRSAAGVCAAFRRSAGVLAATKGDRSGLSWQGKPLTAGALRREIAVTLSGFGLSQPRDNIVAAGAEAAVPHTRGEDDRVLCAEETIVIDLFPRGAMFADCTRTFCVGTAPGDVAAAHGLVKKALEAAYEQAHVGSRMWELQEMTCDIFANSGLPTPVSDPRTKRGYVHGLGHGVGYEIHEYPSFAESARAEGILEPGDVFTLEPGLYDPRAGYGVRLEDLCLATESGIENLTPLPYDLDPRCWPEEPISSPQ